MREIEFNGHSVRNRIKYRFKNLGSDVVAHTVKPSTKEAEAGGSLSSGSALSI